MKMMKKLLLLFYAILLSVAVNAQVTVSPSVPKASESITITYNATGTPLAGAAALKMHSGVVIAGPSSTAWEHVIGTWGDSNSPGTMTNTGGNTWQITFVYRNY